MRWSEVVYENPGPEMESQRLCKLREVMGCQGVRKVDWVRLLGVTKCNIIASKMVISGRWKLYFHVKSSQRQWSTSAMRIAELSDGFAAPKEPRRQGQESGSDKKEIEKKGWIGIESIDTLQKHGDTLQTNLRRGESLCQLFVEGVSIKICQGRWARSHSILKRIEAIIGVMLNWPAHKKNMQGIRKERICCQRQNVLSVLLAWIGLSVHIQLHLNIPIHMWCVQSSGDGGFVRKHRVMDMVAKISVRVLSCSPVVCNAAFMFRCVSRSASYKNTCSAPMAI